MFEQASIFSNPIFVVGVFLIAVIVLIFIIINIWRVIMRGKYKLPDEFKKIVLKISVPKEASAGANLEQQSQASAQHTQEQIAWAENLWSSLGSMKPPSGFKTWLYGRHDEISLEIVAQNKLIYFYIVTPKYLQLYLEQQLQAQYPHAQIDQIDDYNIFSAKSSVTAASLSLLKQDIFPIKSFRKMDVDPLNALTNSLSKIDVSEGAAIQMVIRPVNKDWYSKGKKVVNAVMSGKKISEALGGDKAVYEKVAKGAIDVFKTPDKKENKLPEPQQQLSAMDQELIKSIEEKSGKTGMAVNIRVVSSSNDNVKAKANLDNILNSFAQFNIYEYGNGFQINKNNKSDAVVNSFIHRTFVGPSFVLNTEELASIYHLPLPACPTPNISWLGARKAPAPVNVPDEGVILGKNIYRGKETLIRINPEDRMRHTYSIGMTGTGKSVTLENMCKQDIMDGKGVCFIDPHGNSIDNIAPNIPAERLKDVIYFNPADTEFPCGLNMLEAKNKAEMDFAAQEIINIFYALLADPAMAGPMFEHYMRNALLLLMSDSNDPGTLVELPRVFTDEKYRNEKLAKCDDILVKSFWQKEYAESQKGSMGADMLGYVISKVGRFIENEMMRNIIGQPKSAFNFRDVMDNKKILLVNLSKGQIGDTNSNLLGLIITSKLLMAAMGRADISEDQRQDFFLYIDEFQNYLTDSINIILSEARKYRLSLNVAHQFIGQLTRQGGDTKIRDAIFGNVGTLIVYRVGVEDAEFLAKQFEPVFNMFDLINIEKFNAYIRLMIENQAARPFNAGMFAPTKGDPVVYEQIKADSRQQYGRPKAEVDAEIMRRSKLGEGVEAKPNEMDRR